MWDGNCIVFGQSPFLVSLKAAICRVRYTTTAIIGIAFGILAAILTASYSLWNRDSSLHDKMTASVLRSIIAILGCTAIVAAGITLFCMQGVRAKRFTEKGPRLTLGETVLNMGDLKWGGAYTASIWIGNCGSDMLKIDKMKVMTSCTCLRAAVSKLELKEGDKGELKFGVTPPKKMGYFEYSAYIPSNDPRGGKVLIVKGRVTGAGGVVYPPRLYFDHVSKLDRTGKKLLYIIRRPDINILNVTSDLPFIKCTHTKPTSSAFLINVSLEELPKPGPFDGTIKIITNDPEAQYAEVTVPFSGIIQQSPEDNRL
jgi:hypothetical protein